MSVERRRHLVSTVLDRHALEYAAMGARRCGMHTHTKAMLVMVLASWSGCTSGGDDGGGRGGGDPASADGGAIPGDAGDADAAPAMMACSEPQDGVLALELTYDATPNVTGGTIELQGSETWSLTQPDGSGRVGAHGVRSELRYGDTEAYGGARAETAIVGSSASRYAPGEEFYYGFSVYIPAGWIDDGSADDILFEWHDIADVGETGKAPNLVLAIKNDAFVARVVSDGNAMSTPATELKEEMILLGGLDTSQGTWHDFVFHVVWAYEGRGGLVEAWHKLAADTSYQKLLERAGPNEHNDELEGYVKWGINKPSWLTGPTTADVRVVMHDEIRVGPSFGAVEPGCPR
jgi:hypothetical protein